MAARRTLAALVLVAALVAPAVAGEAQPESLTRAALERRLGEERARLARLKAQLEAIRKGETLGEKAATGKAKPTKPSTRQTPGKSESPAKAKGPLEQHPQVGAADALYRLGRYAEARKVYRAAGAAKDIATPDRIWALLQAGNCSRRLGEFDAAIEQFQAILADYKDKTWFKGHVEWALRTAQWEERWHRAATAAGE